MLGNQSVKQKRFLMTDIGGSINRIGNKILKVGNSDKFLEAVPAVPQLQYVSLSLPVQQIVTVKSREHQTDVVNRKNSLLGKSFPKLKKT